MAIQKQLGSRVLLVNRIKRVRSVAGADVAFLKDPPRACAAVLIFSFPDLSLIETKTAVLPLNFPYVPGLLAFREAPVLLKAFQSLRHDPDLIMIDGQGVAHPRGLGIASHLGLWLNKPTIGCAKSRLYGSHLPPSLRKGAWTPLKDPKDRIIGAVLRTRGKTHPIYVSVGHKLDLANAIQLTLDCAPRYRIPEPTRQADIAVTRLKSEI